VFFLVLRENGNKASTAPFLETGEYEKSGLL
jgi:hypothetical protein